MRAAGAGAGPEAAGRTGERRIQQRTTSSRKRERERGDAAEFFFFLGIFPRALGGPVPLGDMAPWPPFEIKGERGKGRERERERERANKKEENARPREAQRSFFLFFSDSILSVSSPPLRPLPVFSAASGPTWP